ncbi:MAG: tetratricopeptide repeat protein [Spirochaetes bacterium]|nr:tetratricopeptide repeat protein [Spirochaetota bacterium]
MKKIVLTYLIFIALYSSAIAANYYGMGRSAYTYKNFDKAREYFLLDIKDNPDRGDSYYFLGEIEKISKNYDKALEYYQMAVAKKTTGKYLSNSYWNIFILAEDKGDYNTLIKYCRDQWFRTKDRSAKQKIGTIINKQLWTSNDRAIEKYNQGIELAKKGDSAGAASLYKEALEADSSFLAPRFELGMKAYNSGNESEALYQLSYIGERIPFYAEVHMILGELNFKKKNYSAAINNYTSMINFGFIDKSSEYKAMLKRGACNYYLNRYDEAENDITSSLNYIKNDIEPLIMLSAIYIKKKNFDEALKLLNRAETLSASNPMILFQTGSIYYHKNDSQYISYFDRLFDITKKDDAELTKYIKAFKLLLSAYFDKKNYTRSLEIAESINRIPKDSDVIIIGAKSSYNLKQYDKSIRLFEQVQLNNNIRPMLASAYAQVGNKSKAVEILRSLLNDEFAKKEAMKDPLLNSYIKEIEQENQSSSTNDFQQRY